MQGGQVHPSSPGRKAQLQGYLPLKALGPIPDPPQASSSSDHSSSLAPSHPPPPPLVAGAAGALPPSSSSSPSWVGDHGLSKGQVERYSRQV